MTERATPRAGASEPAPLSVQIRRAAPSLQPAMRRVANVIAANPAAVTTMTISDLARAGDTSETTVVRLCQKLGLKGYPQLRITLALETGAREKEDIEIERSGDISEGDDLSSVIAKIAYLDVQSVAETAKLLSLETLGAVVELITHADRVDIFGVGASGLVASDLQQKLHRIGLVSFHWPDQHQALASATHLRSTSVAVGISNSGESLDILEAMQVANEQGAATVAITNAPGSSLAEMVGHVLLTAARETPFRVGASGSRLAQLTVVDCLFVAIAQQTFATSIGALAGTRRVVSSHKSRANASLVPRNGG